MMISGGYLKIKYKRNGILKIRSRNLREWALRGDIFMIKCDKLTSIVDYFAMIRHIVQENAGINQILALLSDYLNNTYTCPFISVAAWAWGHV